VVYLIENDNKRVAIYRSLTMKKENIIKSILDDADIHHNIHINFSKSRNAIEKAKLTDSELEGFNQDMQIEGMMVSDFADNFMFEKINDSGKWHICSAGRMGATLYWDKYWDDKNSGFCFKIEEYDLQEKKLWELKDILKEIDTFNSMVKQMMVNYYAELEFQAKEYKKQLKNEAKQQKYDELIAPYSVNLFELSKSNNKDIRRIALSLTKLLDIK